VVTPNYGYEKRQKELAKKRKKEDKLKEKAQRKLTGQPEDGSPAEDGAEPTASDAPDAGQGTQA